MRYAYFAPYTYEQHQSLIAECQSKPQVTLEMLGQTLDGHDLDLLRIGGPPSVLMDNHVIAMVTIPLPLYIQEHYTIMRNVLRECR